MENTINSLAEIDERACRIMEHSTKEQKALSEGYAKKIADFDTQLHAETEKKLLDFKNELSAKLDKQLAETKSENDASLAAIQKEYNLHHTEIAKEIFERITKVTQ